MEKLWSSNQRRYTPKFYEPLCAPCSCCHTGKVKRRWEPLQLRQSYYLLILHRCFLPWQHLLDSAFADRLLNRRAFGQHIPGQISGLPVRFPLGLTFSPLFSEISAVPGHEMTTTSRTISDQYRIWFISCSHLVSRFSAVRQWTLSHMFELEVTFKRIPSVPNLKYKLTKSNKLNSIFSLFWMTFTVTVSS